MLSGDSRATAERVAVQIGIEEVIAEVLPGDKAAKVAELQGQGRKVAMVGDGVNDAAALEQADVGIAIGTGTDVAVETADVVLMRSDPRDVATAITIGRGTRGKERQNIAWRLATTAWRSRSPPARSNRSASRSALRSPRSACPAQASSSRSTPSGSGGCTFPGNHTRRVAIVLLALLASGS